MLAMGEEEENHNVVQMSHCVGPRIIAVQKHSKGLTDNLPLWRMRRWAGYRLGVGRGAHSDDPLHQKGKNKAQAAAATAASKQA